MNNSNDLLHNLKQLGIISGTKGAAGKLVVTNCLPSLFLPAKSIVNIGFSKDFCKQYKLSEDVFTTTNKTELLLTNINNKEQAELLKEKAVFVEKDVLLKYNPDYIFEDELIGASVIDATSGTSIGTVCEVWSMPANDVWLVDTKDGKLPLPVVEDVIKSVDLKNKIIKVNMLDGLMDIIIKNT